MYDKSVLTDAMCLSAIVAHIVSLFALWRYMAAISKSGKPNRLFRFLSYVRWIDATRVVIVIVLFYVAIVNIPPEYIHDSRPWRWLMRTRLSILYSPYTATVFNFSRLPAELCNIFRFDGTSLPALLQVSACAGLAARAAAAFAVKAAIWEKLMWCGVYWVDDILLRLALGYC